MSFRGLLYEDETQLLYGNGTDYCTIIRGWNIAWESGWLCMGENEANIMGIRPIDYSMEMR